MPKGKCPWNPTHVKAMWNMMEKAGKKPVELKFNDDGTFRIMTEEYVKAKYGEPAKKTANEWDEVYEPGSK